MSDLVKNTVIPIFRRSENQSVEFLILKSSENKSNNWQLLQGTAQEKEDLQSTVYRLLVDKLEIVQIISATDTEINFPFKSRFDPDKIVRLFIVRVKSDQEIKTSAEYTDFHWYNYQTLILILKDEQIKNILAKSFEIIIQSNL